MLSELQAIFPGLTSFQMLQLAVSLLGPMVLFVSASAALYNIRIARRNFREKETLNLIEKAESHTEYQKIRQTFSRHRVEGTLTALNDPKSDAEKTDRQAVLDYLNHYELVALSIRRGVLDSRFYRSWMGGPVVRDWNAAAAFIKRERYKWDPVARRWRYYPRTFSNLEWLVRRWSPQAKRPQLVLVTQDLPERSSAPGDTPLPDR